MAGISALAQADENKRRRRLMDAAHKALKSGRAQRAIIHYGQWLAIDRRDHEVWSKVAPLLAKEGRWEAAWGSYERAVRGLRSKGFVDKAAALLGQAIEQNPFEVDAWLLLVEMQVQGGRRSTAIRTLRRARRVFLKRKPKDDLLQILEIWTTLQPHNPDVCLELAKVLRQCGEHSRAEEELLRLSAQAHAESFAKRLNKERFYVQPSFSNFRQWLITSSNSN